MAQAIYVLVVHKSGKGFALNRQYGVVFSLIENADGYLETFRALDRPAKILDHWAGWLPSAGWQRPAWIEGIPESEFTAYWLENAHAEAAA